MIPCTSRAMVLLCILFTGAGFTEEPTSISKKYQALKSPPTTAGTTWALLDRDGANRAIEPYFSSLGQGEAGTGVASSPPFVIADDEISFTICGHDGAGGGEGKNYIALVDARKGEMLMQTAAPGHDGMQQRSWNVRPHQGKEVRIEIHDGNSGSAYGWMGIGKIDAGSSLTIDFRQGMPDGWERPERSVDVRYETIAPGVPFKRSVSTFTLIPNSGQIELPCGFSARRLFFLGGTVSGGQPLQSCGAIEVHYATGSPDVFPLIIGFTLDGRYKRLSSSKASYLHPSADPYQPYLVVAPRGDRIEKIRLVASPDHAPIPRITAITCESEADNENLIPLPDCGPSATEEQWIRSHQLAAGSPDLDQIIQTIRVDHKLAPNDR
ncbi:hypothetical protein [Novipirellula artificiosorum]|uniref:Secreted protein n=1 Tax=Novipirellula artificiosorum TaxID=2528016 RepID=A0A5C6E1J2_9BACT|nr:hypothetical protein [Novipirellula artificiosorum]TWU42760.1 hypothetical protein Poly41_10600 [Novipirellula artificiosorum]